MSRWLRDALERLPDPDEPARTALRARAGEVLRPPGALARLDDVAAHIAGWQRTPRPHITKPSVVVFAADHGVADAVAVSAYPTHVTAAMLDACRSGQATIAVLARSLGVAFSVVDVGVGRPTGDLRVEPALSPERFAAAVDAGVAAVESLDTDLVVFGEIGIGNTTAAAAVSAGLLGGDAADWVGRGTGVDDAGLARKLAAVQMAQARVGAVEDPLEVLREVGGAELAAIAGAVAAARLRSIPVVLDGYVVTAAALALELARPGALEHCLLGHGSAEPGHARLARRLGLRPLLRLDMRLGEGSGAVLAVPLIRAACDAVVLVPTFAEWFGDRA